MIQKLPVSECARAVAALRNDVFESNIWCQALLEYGSGGGGGAGADASGRLFAGHETD